MMRQMRENTKWIMLLTALAFVALMVFQWGMDLTGRSSAQATGGRIGDVNGDPISYQAYLTVYRNLYQQQQQAAHGDPISSAMNKQIEDAAWNQIVMQHLVAQELQHRGIRVTNDEIRQAARYAPPPEFMSNQAFMTDGQFDINKYHQFLSSPGVDPQLLIQLEDYYRDVIPRSKLYFQTTAGLVVPDSQLWNMWRDSHETVKVRYIAFDPATLIPDAGVSVSDAEIKAYYDQHQDDFHRPAQATIHYIVLDRAPTAADSAVARDRAQQVRKELEGGADFAQVATRESADSLSAQEGGAMTIQKGQNVPPAFEQAVFSLPIGKISEPIQTQFGLHIIRVDSRTADEAQIHHILIPIERTPESADSLLTRADSMDAMGTRLPLDQVAQNLKLKVRDGQIIPSLSFLPGVGQADEGADWALHEAKPSDVSRVFETHDAYYMLELVSRTEDRTLSLEEAKPSITAAISAEKKLARARDMAREAVDKLRGGQSLDEVAKAYHTEVHEAGPFTRGEYVAGLGRLNTAIGTAFGLDVGQTSGVVEANNSIYIIQTIEKQPADHAEWEKQIADQRKRVQQALAEQQWNSFLAALKDNAKIVDRRDQLQEQQVAQN